MDSRTSTGHARPRGRHARHVHATISTTHASEGEEERNRRMRSGRMAAEERGRSQPTVPIATVGKEDAASWRYRTVLVDHVYHVPQRMGDNHQRMRREARNHRQNRGPKRVGGRCLTSNGMLAPVTQMLSLADRNLWQEKEVECCAQNLQKAGTARDLETKQTHLQVHDQCRCQLRTFQVCERDFPLHGNRWRETGRVHIQCFAACIGR
mmetsp:Transcript_4118/g.25970  ORF Transcript_4118/g.25970 Transcript_4118/m.25970 type:complete len:209 (-) Transcript_4118:2468-3094(-)